MTVSFSLTEQGIQEISTFKNLNRWMSGMSHICDTPAPYARVWKARPIHTTFPAQATIAASSTLIARRRDSEHEHINLQSSHPWALWMKNRDHNQRRTKLEVKARASINENYKTATLFGGFTKFGRVPFGGIWARVVSKYAGSIVKIYNRQDSM